MVDNIDIGDVLIRDAGLHATRRIVLAVLTIEDLTYVVTKYLRKPSKAMPHYLVNKPRIDAIKYLKSMDYRKEEQ